MAGGFAGVRPHNCGASRDDTAENAARPIASPVATMRIYLGREFKAIATLPDGTTKPLLWIQHWDFNWQDRYFYKEPVLLPKGTRIDATITYDNSSDNPDNPCNPPVRVQWGMQSTDEMGALRFQMVAATPAGEASFQAIGPAIRAAIANAARSDAAKDAAKRYAEQQARYRAAAGAPLPACGG